MGGGRERRSSDLVSFSDINIDYFEKTERSRPRSIAVRDGDNPFAEEGSHAVSEAVRLARVQVVSAYPITPQTHIVEALSEYIEDGTLNARFVNVESEHSAMASVIAASSTGGRTFTATSSQGLALMHELLHWASGGRLSIVMAEVNRALAPGWNIWSKYSVNPCSNALSSCLL